MTMIATQPAQQRTGLQHNFNAGPSVLPREVLEEASHALLDFNGTGLSVLEIGHRTKTIEAVRDEAVALLRELMALDADHEALFLPGGASTQFFQVPMNLLDETGSAAFTDTGVWATKAIKEAKLFGDVHVVCSSKDKNYSYLPKQFSVAPTETYLHLTTNNTIYGTQWQNLTPFYQAEVPLVADMSSDILSRPLDFNRFDLIYAGAQKNVGAAGVTIVVVNKNSLGKVKRALPTMLDYRQHIEAASMLNTPPVFAIYLCLLTLRWLKKSGGVAQAEIRNKQKAALLYNTIDTLPLFTGTVVKEDRSLMNACFLMADSELENLFLQTSKEAGVSGLQGHRSVGGFRASLYNALPYESVVVLTDIMKHIAQKHG